MTAAAVAVLAAAAAGIGTSPPALAATPLKVCTTIDIPVALTQGGPVAYRISGEYCMPHGQHAAALVVAVPGASYDHNYWDFPADPGTYSFVDQELAARRAVLAIDRIGTGQSGMLDTANPAGNPVPCPETGPGSYNCLPPSARITATADAYTLHQVITWARTTAGYATVDVVGHSLGSVTASLDAAEYPADPTALVLTGMLHQISAAALPGLEADIRAAGTDPVLTGEGRVYPDSGYLTTVPGTRGTLFYSSGADPAVVAEDEQTKDVVSSAEATVTAGFTEPWTPGITAPVLLVAGQEDALFCGGPGDDCASDATMLAAEQPFYTGASSLTADVIASTGHDTQLSPTAPESDAVISRFLCSH